MGNEGTHGFTSPSSESHCKTQNLKILKFNLTVLDAAGLVWNVVSNRYLVTVRLSVDLRVILLALRYEQWIIQRDIGSLKCTVK